MAKSLLIGCWKLGVASLLAVVGAITARGDYAHAQITPDGTLGAESSVVTPNAPGSTVDVIEGGATRGANLFHSFEQFSVPTGGEAFFNNALDIQNIISRVTGGSISNIDGLLQANGAANLFLLNPNGIVFGPNAELSIGGSFVGSTASSLNFADGTSFSATAHPTTPLLTVSVPIGLQYVGTAGSIINQSQATNSSGQVVGLAVLPLRTLALAGGEVRLERGGLQAPGGRVELLGVAFEGTVGLNFDNSVLGLSFPDGIERADVSFTSGARVDVTAGGGGSVAVNARNLDILGGTSLSAGIGAGLGTVGSQAGDITLNATGVTTISQASTIANNFTEGATGGEAGDINIKTGSLLINDLAKVNTIQNRENAQDQGDSGNISVQAFGNVSLNATGSRLDSALSTLSFGGNAGKVSVLANGSVSISDSEIVTSSFGGAGGTILLQANGGSISVTDNSFIASNVFNSNDFSGQGNAGDITLKANGSISFANYSWLTTQGGLGREAPTEGNGGVIYIQGRSLSVTDGSRLATSTFSRGSAGKIQVDTSDSVEISGRYPVIRPNGVDYIRLSGEWYSQLSTTTESGASGNGGEININTGTLRISDGGTLSASSRSDFRGGNITVNADVLEITGGGQILTTAFSNGDAGDINVNATDRIAISGNNPNFFDIFNSLITLPVNPPAQEVVERSIGPIDPFSGIFGNTGEGSSGSGGSLKIETGKLIVQDEASVNVGSAGAGAAGNLTVSASSIRLENLAVLSSDTTAGQGSIFLRSGDLVLRRGSNIRTDATGTATGGNISIDTGVIAGLENSDITANAFGGQGGIIDIKAQGIFGLVQRDSEELRTLLGTDNPNSLDPARLPTSDITAISQTDPSLRGQVTINNPDVDPTQGLVELPAELVDASNQVAQGCPSGVFTGESKFIITGRGGLPPNPNEPLNGDNVLTDWSTLDSDAETHSSVAPATNSTKESAPTQIVEATGWMTNNKGEVILTATAPSATLDIPWLPDSDCHAPEPES